MVSSVNHASPSDAVGASFGELIARRRRRFGLSQRDLAESVCTVTGRATMTRHEMSRYERGGRLPHREVLAAIAACLDVPLAGLWQRVAQQRAQQRAGRPLNRSAA